MRENGGDGPDVMKGVFAGIVGGLVGTFAMSEFQAWWSRTVLGIEPQSSGGKHDARDWQEINEDQNANEIAAQTVAQHTIGRSLDDEELAVAAPVMHYLFGGVMGGFYGALAENTPAARALSGAAWGTAVWVGADEIAMPALGLSQRTDVQPLMRHVHSLAAHIVYGVATELTRRGVRAAIA